MDNFSQVQGIVRAIQTDRLRFLTAERRRAYTAILWLLLARRRNHQVEVYYDDLLVEALALIPGLESGPYDPDVFRSDVQQLLDWGNLTLRLEPRRIETLADRRLQKFLCRLDEETAPVLEFLEARVRGTAAAVSDHGRHLLRDAAERLSEAVSLFRKIRRAGPAETSRADQLYRFSYLCLEADRKVDDAARELAAFDAALVLFVINPFRLEALAEVVDQLERYVEDYVAEATERARLLYRAARALLRPSAAGPLAEAQAVLEKRLRDDIFHRGTAGPLRTPLAVLESLAPFFAPAGRFETLLDRVHATTRDVVRRVHAHLESVRARNIRIETLRDRTRDMARLHDNHVDTANQWINALFRSAHLVTDLRSGTPENRAAPPRPARRYEPSRGVYTGGYLEGKRGFPGQTRALQKALWLRLGRFVDEQILHGQARAPLHEASFSGATDFRLLLEAVKAHDLRSGRNRRHLSYGVAQAAANGSREARARFELPDGALDAPDLVFYRQNPGP